MAKPTVLALTLATLPGRYGDGREGWVCADEVAHRLALFGFEPSAQQVAGWLRSAINEDSPCIESRRREYVGVNEYRVTRFGKGEVDNRLGAGVRLFAPWLPTMRGQRYAE